MGRIHDYFDEYRGKYNTFQSVIKKIKRYEYADGEKYSNLPCYFERGFKRRGKDVDSSKSIYIYGFDKYNNLIYIKSGNSESFLIYFNESTNLFCYENDHIDSKLKVLKYIEITEKNNEDILYGTVKIDKWQNVYAEKYHYENDILVRIENPIDFEYGTYNDILAIEYDSNGSVIQITDKESWLANGLVYKKISSDEVAALKEKIINNISQNIINYIVNYYNQEDEKIYYIAIEVHEESHTVLSSMNAKMAYESERAKYITENGPKDEKYIWEYSNNQIEIYDKQLEMECNILIQYYINHSDCYSESEKITKCIINKLREFNWQKYVSVSENFEILETSKYD